MAAISSAGVVDTGWITLVGADVSQEQNKFCADVAVPVSIATRGIHVVGMMYKATESGSGAVIPVAGTLYVFNADPTIAQDDTAMAAASAPMLLWYDTIAATGWATDTNGAFLYVAKDVVLPTPKDGTNYYAAFFQTSAAALNDSAADDELLQFKLYYETR